MSTFASTLCSKRPIVRFSSPSSVSIAVADAADARVARFWSAESIFMAIADDDDEEDDEAEAFERRAGARPASLAFSVGVLCRFGGGSDPLASSSDFTFHRLASLSTDLAEAAGDEEEEDEDDEDTEGADSDEALELAGSSAAGSSLSSGDHSLAAM